MKALISTNSDGYGIMDVDIPVPHPGSILVRIHAIALGTRNTKIIDYLNGPGSLGGCEFAGIVEKLGEGVTRFKEGDRVFTIAFGLQSFGNTDYTFAELALAEQDLACHVPKSVSFEQASSMGLALTTASLALFQQPGLQLKVEGGAGEPVLVSGGATAVGTMATQLLKM
jgi:aspyridone synthetase trans-acting enoyl reductase